MPDQEFPEKSANIPDDGYWMRRALRMAQKAEAEGEVPVGAVLIKDNTLVAQGRNQSIIACDPTAHAEIIAMRAAGSKLDNYRLVDTTLYVTLEPCVMCAGAIIHARIGRLVYGACDPKSGADRGVFKLLQDDRFNHRVAVTGGVLADDCAKLLKDFFKDRRKK